MLIFRYDPLFGFSMETLPQLGVEFRFTEREVSVTREATQRVRLSRMRP